VIEHGSGKFVTCPICGKDIKVYGKQKRTYCSINCMQEGYRSRLRGVDNPNYRHGPKKCKKCGENISPGSRGHCRKCVPLSGEDNHFHGKKHSKEARLKMARKRKGRNYWKGRHHTKEARKKISSATKERWQNYSKEQKEKVLRCLQSGLEKQLSYKQTKPERQVEEILKNLNIENERNKLMYDKFLVDFYLPGSECIIEVFGDYWHGNESIFPVLSARQKRQAKKDKARVSYLTTCGHRVIVVWENDLKRNAGDVKHKLSDTILQ